MWYTVSMSERDETAVLFGMPFSITGFDAVCAKVDARIRTREPGFVVTPNVNLVCTFHREPAFREAYRQAIAERYRFLSFGDSMLIV